MSRPLFFTSMMRPEMMFIAAISTRTDRITNITLSSMLSAAQEAAGAVAPGPEQRALVAGSQQGGRQILDTVGVGDHHLDLVGHALAVEVALRLGEGHVDAGAGRCPSARR